MSPIPIRIITLESLFTLRTNPLRLFRLDVLRRGWLLVLIAVLLWVTSITASFPPSAMTVATASYHEVSPLDKIPGLNVSSVSESNPVARHGFRLSILTVKAPFEVLLS